MPAVPERVLTVNQMQHVRRWLREHLSAQVAIEVWSREEHGAEAGDRDTNPQGWMSLALMRQLKLAHPAITVTPYDLDRDAGGAEERGIEQAPTVIMRCRGRSIRTVGVFFGAVFQPFLDELSYLSRGTTPLAPHNVERLQAIEGPVTIEAYVSAFDPISIRMIPLLGAFAVAGRRVRMTQVEVSQFPILAGQHLIEEVPVVVINGHRFTGHYNERQLLEQIEGVVGGSDEPVARERVLTSPYVSDEEMRRRVAEQQASAPAAPPPPSPPPSGPPHGGLYIPGRG